MLIYVKNMKKKTFYGQTDGRTTQNYSSEPHKNKQLHISSFELNVCSSVLIKNIKKKTNSIEVFYWETNVESQKSF